MASCRHHNEPSPTPTEPTQQSLPILLEAGGAQPVSRTDYSPLEEKYSDFAVLAWKTVDGQRQYVMSRDENGSAPYRVVWDETASAWVYDGITYDTDKRQYLKFWDDAATQYDFAAYAPYSDGDGNPLTQASFDANGRLVLTGARGNTTQSEDWVECRYVRYHSPAPSNTSLPAYDHDLLDGLSPHEERPRQVLTDIVPLVFHHLMPVIEFRIYGLNGNELTLKSIEITVADGNAVQTRGDYSPLSGWDFSAYPTDRTDLLYATGAGEEVTAGKTKDTATQLTTMVELPQALSDYVLYVSMETTQVTITGRLDLAAATPVWEGGNHYIYYIAVDLIEEVILFDVDIELFKWQEGEDTIPEAFPNW